MFTPSDKSDKYMIAAIIAILCFALSLFTFAMYKASQYIDEKSQCDQPVEYTCIQGVRYGVSQHTLFPMYDKAGNIMTCELP